MVDTILLFMLKLYLKIHRVKFGLWMSMESESRIIDDAIKQELSKLPGRVYEFVSSHSFVLKKWLKKMHWQQVFLLYFSIRTSVKLNKIPLLIPKGKGKDDEPVPWEYEGRNAYYLSHLLANKYGWTLDYIRSLDVNDALAMLQEVMVDDQLSREFQWSLSEIAYPYNSSTKKSEFKELPRPYFMWKPMPKIKKVQILKKAVPMGVVQDVGKMAEYFKAHDEL